MYSLKTGKREEKHMRTIIDSGANINLKGREIGGAPNFPSFFDFRPMRTVYTLPHI